MAMHSKNLRTDANDEDIALEVIVISAESLKLPYTLLSRRLRPYVCLSSPSSPAVRTCTDEAGADDPTWGEKLVVPVGPSFLDNNIGTDNNVRLNVLSEGGILLGPTLLGWCQIHASDVLDSIRLVPPGSIHRLSYALRCPQNNGFGGGRGGDHGVLHVAVRLIGSGMDRINGFLAPEQAMPVEPGWCQVAIGIPVAVGFPVAAAGISSFGWGDG